MYLIPVGSTGGAAKEILSDIEKSISMYPYLIPHLQTLKNSTNAQELVATIITIINTIKKGY